jgi:prepilin-type N-terminal cleavage/methylation domain-containing protein
MSPRPAANAAQGGFSLVETLVSMAIFLFILLAVFTSYTPNRAIQARGETRVDVQQNARLALAEMTREIRMAGYFPENFGSPPADPALATAVRIATDGALAVYGDTDGSGASTIALFCLDGTVVRLIRGAVDAVGAYTCAGGEIIAENVADLEFRYYDADNGSLPSPPAASFELDEQAVGAVAEVDDVTERDGVRKIAITLTTTAGAGPRREPHVYALTSEVTLRNVQ